MINKPVLINGMGTVGSRVARLLLSMGIEVHGAKYSAKPDDRKTKEILRLYDDFKAFPMAVAPGDNYEERKNKFKEAGFQTMDKCDFSQYKVVIDATSGDTTLKHAQNYKKNVQPFLVQGGTKFDVLSNDFVSAPKTVGESYDRYDRGARQVSCNTTFCSTALGLVLKQVAPADINEVNVTLQRRCHDPGEDKEMKSEPELKESHHAGGVMNVVPVLNGKVFSRANVNDWQHFHRTSIIIDFAKPVDAKKIKQFFRDYERCVYLEHDIGEKNVRSGIQTLLSVCKRLGITDGDCLLPVYNIKQLSPTQIEIVGYTPQRSIVALSCVDWIWGSLGIKEGWNNAVAFTNDNAKWHGYGIRELKNVLEQRITPQIFTSGQL